MQREARPRRSNGVARVPAKHHTRTRHNRTRTVPNHMSAVRRRPRAFDRDGAASRDRTPHGRTLRLTSDVTGMVHKGEPPPSALAAAACRGPLSGRAGRQLQRPRGSRTAPRRRPLFRRRAAQNNAPRK